MAVTVRRVVGLAVGVGLVFASASGSAFASGSANAPGSASGSASVQESVQASVQAAASASAQAAVSESIPAVAYRPPVASGLTRRFDPPAVPWGRGHRGVDLAAEPGDEVRSPGPGVVTYAGELAGRGVVTVRHPDGLRSSLEPVAVAVRVGDEVAAGTALGTLEAGGTHLGVHWGVRDAAGYRDPLGLLPRAGPVVLLPVP